MIYANDLFEVFSMGQMGKISLKGNLDQIALKDICEMLGIIMGYNWLINVTFRFSRKFFEENLAI